MINYFVDAFTLISLIFVIALVGGWVLGAIVELFRR